MSRTDMLCCMDREMMLTFSGQCVARLDTSLPLRLALAPFHRFFDANVHKEIEKDRLCIEYAADAFEKKLNRSDINLHELFEMTIEIDNAFLRSLANPLFPFEVKFDDLAEIRKRRMLSFITLVFDLLGNWHDASPLAVVVQRTYTEERYRVLLHEILHLYNVETRLLGDAIALPLPVGRVRDRFAEKLFAAMERTAENIARTYAREVFSTCSSSDIKPVSPQPAQS